MKQSVAQTILDSVPQEYERIAPHFSQTRHSLWPELKAFLPHVKEGDRVLDIGCGNGRLYQLFEGRDVTYVGIDRSKSLIAEAEKSHVETSNSRFIEDDMCSLGRIDGLFDHAFMIASLHHIPSKLFRLQALRAAAAKLKEGGRLSMTVWNLHQPRYRGLVLQSYVLKVIMPRSIDCRDVYVPWKNTDGKTLARRYYHAFTARELTKLLHAAGFKIEKMWYAADGKEVDRSAGHNLCVVARRA